MGHALPLRGRRVVAGWRSGDCSASRGDRRCTSGSLALLVAVGLEVAANLVQAGYIAQLERRRLGVRRPARVVRRPGDVPSRTTSTWIRRRRASSSRCRSSRRRCRSWRTSSMLFSGAGRKRRPAPAYAQPYGAPAYAQPVHQQPPAYQQPQAYHPPPPQPYYPPQQYPSQQYPPQQYPPQQQPQPPAPAAAGPGEARRLAGGAAGAASRAACRAPAGAARPARHAALPQAPVRPLRRCLDYLRLRLLCDDRSSATRTHDCVDLVLPQGNRRTRAKQQRIPDPYPRLSCGTREEPS